MVLSRRVLVGGSSPAVHPACIQACPARNWQIVDKSRAFIIEETAFQVPERLFSCQLVPVYCGDYASYGQHNWNSMDSVRQRLSVALPRWVLTCGTSRVVLRRRGFVGGDSPVVLPGLHRRVFVGAEEM